MIRFLSSERRKICASPSMQACTEIAKKLVARYPQSHQDVIEGDVVGAKSLTMQSGLQYQG